MNPITIPFNRPCLEGMEMEHVSRAIRQGHASGDGPYSKQCQALLESILGVGKALVTTSCTHALEMSALLLNLGPEDEVILPSFTFVSTANAFVLRGARPVFSDVRADTLNLDETKLAALITPRTKAIVPVHYAGVGCDMESIGALAAQRGIPVVEDNAHGLFGRYRGRFLGTFGGLSALSFHETKNFSCGEGGALLINDPQFIERAEILREKGTDRSRFFRGQVDKYSWVDLGSSYVISDLLAAFLFAQLEARASIQAKRQRVWERYAQGLSGWARRTGARLPVVPPECGQSYHMFHVLLPTPERRDALLTHLRSRGMLGVFHYLPLHLSRMGRTFGGEPGQCPVTEDVSTRLVRLPFYNDLSEQDQDRVIAAVEEVGA
ncbi:MAG: dTDP-4-amino-4,6-dideoxygalactose transaminase [Chthoniobacter sp.]|nr:dTDP-4-amino-4,6-dideoxygalactose transaminase [Chthoniobacter sp.]